MKQLLVKIDDGLMDRLNKMPNKSEYVREAIAAYLDGGTPAGGVGTPMTESRVREIIKEELSEQTTNKIVIPNTSRSKSDITTDIGQLEAERDEKLEYSQDYADNKRIALEYKTKIDALWAEFRAVDRSIQLTREP